MSFCITYIFAVVAAVFGVQTSTALKCYVGSPGAVFVQTCSSDAENCLTMEASGQIIYGCSASDACLMGAGFTCCHQDLCNGDGSQPPSTTPAIERLRCYWGEPARVYEGDCAADSDRCHIINSMGTIKYGCSTESECGSPQPWVTVIQCCAEKLCNNEITTVRTTRSTMTRTTKTTPATTRATLPSSSRPDTTSRPTSASRPMGAADSTTAIPNPEVTATANSGNGSASLVIESVLIAWVTLLAITFAKQ